MALKEGEVVLIIGATEGVGSYAVQMAARRGARVIATARPGAEAYCANSGRLKCSITPGATWSQP